MSEIECQRHLFDIPDDVAYLNCAYISPLLNAAADAARGGLAREQHPWEILPADFFSAPETARGLFAALIGATPDDVAIIPAASYGVALAAANLPVAAGQEILLLEEQYPSNSYAWLALAERSGARIRRVSRPADGGWTPAVLAAIEPNTALAALPHCHWMDGGLVDLVAVADALRRVGAALLVDASQSLGALPLDVGAVRPDYLVTAGYKWMLCPYGLSFLYVAPPRQNGRPLEENPLNRSNGPDFQRLSELTDDYAAGARRFDVGERAHFTLLPAAIAALRQLLDWQPARTQATLAARNRAFAERAAGLGLTSLSPDLRAGHFLGLRFPDSAPESLLPVLQRARIHVSLRGSSLRITPHLYNTQGDFDRLFDALASNI